MGMTVAVLVAVMLVVVGVGRARGMDERGWVSVARCRASCLDVFIPVSPQEEYCGQDADCYIVSSSLIFILSFC